MREPARKSPVISSVRGLEQRIQQQFFEALTSARTQTAEPLSRPIAEAVQALVGRSPRAAMLACGSGVRRATRSTSRPSSSAAFASDRAGGDRGPQTRRSDRDRQRPRHSTPCSPTGAGARFAGRRVAGDQHEPATPANLLAAVEAAQSREMTMVVTGRTAASRRRAAGRDRRAHLRSRRRRAPGGWGTSSSCCLCDAPDRNCWANRRPDEEPCVAGAAGARRARCSRPARRLLSAGPPAHRRWWRPTAAPGTQVDDSTIERSQGARRSTPRRRRVTATSYNRLVLVTGEVPTEADKAGGRAGGGPDRDGARDGQRAWRSWAVRCRRGPTTASSPGKVKAAIFDAKDLQVATEGRDRARHRLPDGAVTEAEANRATEVARVVERRAEGRARVPDRHAGAAGGDRRSDRSTPAAAPASAAASAPAEPLSACGPAQPVIRLEENPSQRRPPAAARRRRTGRRAPSPGPRAVAPRFVEQHAGPGPCASVRRRNRSRTLPSTIVGPRLSICQLCAAPLADDLEHGPSSAARRARRHDRLGEVLHRRRWRVWLTILASWPAPLARRSRERRP